MKRADLLRHIDTILREDRKVQSLELAVTALAHSRVADSKTLQSLKAAMDEAETERDASRRALMELAKP